MRSITLLLERLAADTADRDAFPRPTLAVSSCFAIVGIRGKKTSPVTTAEISAETTLSTSQVCVALEKLAGLLALYGGAYILRRVILPNDGRLYGYYIEPTNL